MKKKTHGKSPEAADSNFFEYASDGMAITDMHGNMIDANPACCAMLGYSRDEIISKKLPEFYPPEDLAAAPIHFKEASEGRIVRIGRRLIRRDGALIDVEIHGRMMPDGRLFATVRDMSAQKRAEEELKNSEAQLTTLFDNSPSAIAFVHKLVYVRVNDMYLAMFGYSKDELIGKTVLDVVPPECHPQVLQLIAKRRGGDKSPLHFTTKGRRKNGETFDLEIDSTVCTVGEKQFSIAHHRDLTVHKRTEEALNKAQKLEALGVLAGGIAHDFNNLMGGVFGFIDLARGCSKEPLVSEFLGKAMTGIERARSLTQQLLTFSKGGAPIRKVGHLFPCIKDAVQFALSGSSVSCDIDVQDNLHPCNFDENQITQVVDNIVINALHAMPLGGTIELAARNVAIGEEGHPKLPKGDYVKLSIKDHGIGIPEELQARIFDPFFTTKTKGHGLGLATSYSIINRHGGAIDVESEPGKGSVFHVFLPAATEPCPREPMQSEVNHRGSGVIIVMDDEELLRRAVGVILTILGYTPEFAVNGKEALEIFITLTKSRRRLAGLILDLTIPGGTGGKETVAEIRKLDPDIPVFVASGYADDHVMQNPSGYGFTASIRKPFVMSELAEMLSKYLKNEK